MAEDAALVEIGGLRVRYRRGRREVEALKGVDLTVRAGERVGIVGESASGKSTLALAILHALGPGGQAVAGWVRVAGRDIARMSGAELRVLRGSQIALVQQEPMAALNPAMTVGRQLREVPRLAASTNSPAEAEGRLRRMLDEVHLRDGARILASYPHQLSGGQLQRVCIAMALLGEPSMLILDEPTTALDTTTGAAIVELIREIADRRGTALLLISHDLDLVAALADRVLVLLDGEVVDQGDVDAVLAGGRHPYTRALLADAAARRPDRAATQGNGAAALLRAAGVRKDYPVVGRWGREAGRVAAVRGLDVEIAPGETLALVGESGSGKSTLGRIVAGLETADGGQVLLDGLEIGGLPVNRRPRAVRTVVQMVFQDPDGSLNPSLPVGWQLARAAILSGGAATRPAARRHADALLDRVGLPREVAARFPRELSGGQKQRVAIARAFAGTPRLVVADEPVSALDASLRRAVLELLRDLQAAHGTALMFITHDLAVARGIADRVAVMRAGVIVESGPVSAVFDAPRHPYTRALLAADLDRRAG